jgi:hypothetical protein
MSRRAVVTYVCIDSRDRDKALDPSPSSYTVSFAETVRNVREVELVYAQYERFSPDNYFMLVLAECSPNSVLVAGRAAVSTSSAFTVLPQNESFNQYTTSMFRSIKTFDPPLARLDRMTISFLLPTGVVATSFKDHMLRFEIRRDPYRRDLMPQPSALPDPMSIWSKASPPTDDGSLSGGLSGSHEGTLAVEGLGTPGEGTDTDREKVRRRLLVAAALLLAGGASYTLVRKRFPGLLPALF